MNYDTLGKVIFGLGVAIVVITAIFGISQGMRRSELWLPILVGAGVGLIGRGVRKLEGK